MARIPSADAPTLVMLHEGLGSLSMWRDFPRKLADRLGCRVLVYSRHGHGQSTPLSARRHVSYMHDEAWVVLPELLERLRIERPILFGHSDGGSIALIHASRHPVRGSSHSPRTCLSRICSVASIATAKVAFETGDLRKRLGVITPMSTVCSEAGTTFGWILTSGVEHRRPSAGHRLPDSGDPGRER